MRCPKCSYISFDKVTSCVQCSADVTEIAHALNGTAFKSLGTFFLGSLIPDYEAPVAPSFEADQEAVAEDFAFDSGTESEDLDISMDAIGDFGEVPDLPGDLSEEDFSLSPEDIPEFDDGEISLDGHELPDMDLSGFEDSTDLEAAPIDDVALDDDAEFDLSGIELEEETDLDMAGEDLELEDATISSTEALSDIDLSLGEDELDIASEDEEVLDLGALEMETTTEPKKATGPAELPDLEL